MPGVVAVMGHGLLGQSTFAVALAESVRGAPATVRSAASVCEGTSVTTKLAADRVAGSWWFPLRQVEAVTLSRVTTDVARSCFTPVTRSAGDLAGDSSRLRSPESPALGDGFRAVPGQKGKVSKYWFAPPFQYQVSIAAPGNE